MPFVTITLLEGKGKEYIKALLNKGKAVITANKDIIADCGPELIRIAQENNTCLYFDYR